MSPDSFAAGLRVAQAKTLAEIDKHLLDTTLAARWKDLLHTIRRYVIGGVPVPPDLVEQYAKFLGVLHGQDRFGK